MDQALRRHSRRLLVESEPCAGVRIAMHGKALRGSFDHFLDQKAVRILSAFASDSQVVLGQVSVPEKSNEIVAVQQLIQELGLSGCLFTLDAQHCQKTSRSPNAPAITSWSKSMSTGMQPELHHAVREVAAQAPHR